MSDFCLYFQAHQPNRLKEFTFFDIGKDPFYENDGLNKDILSKVSENCYLPANQLFKNLIEESKGAVKLSYSLSGVFLEQLEIHRPDVLESFQELHDTGSVELLCETYYHSLCFRASGDEFKRQVAKQQETLQRLFGISPTTFRHTELIYFNELAAVVEDLGFKAQLAEGVDRVLQGRSPNHLYRSPNVKEMPVILRNNDLSDDLAFRFADPNWASYPLTPEKYANWIKEAPGDFTGCFLDYETIGEHIHESAGIFDFWKALPAALQEKGINMITPSEAAAKYKTAGEYDCHDVTSWADTSKNISAWKSNPMQLEASKKILTMEKAIKSQNDPALLHQWSKMQTSDHFYYMFTGHGSDREVHEHFSPFQAPYDAYLTFMNALSDLQIRAES